MGKFDVVDEMLDALTTEEGINEIPIDQIDLNPFQPRQTIANESLQELAESIKQHGFYGQLVVREKENRYQLVYGERRLRAAKLAGLGSIPARIQKLTDKQMLEIALTENIQREDLKPIEEAQTYQMMKDKLGYSIRGLAERLGKPKSYIFDRLALLQPKVKTVRIPDSLKKIKSFIRIVDKIETASDEEKEELQKLKKKIDQLLT